MNKLSFSSFFFNIVKYKKFYFEIKYLGEYAKNDKTVLSKPLEFNKKILIYGFGPYGEELFVKLFCKCVLVGVVDRNYKKMERYISDPSLVDHYSFDYVVVTAMNSKARKEIFDYLHLQHKIPEEKIVLLDYV